MNAMTDRTLDQGGMTLSGEAAGKQVTVNLTFAIGSTGRRQAKPPREIAMRQRADLGFACAVKARDPSREVPAVIAVAASPLSVILPIQRRGMRCFLLLSPGR